MLSLVIHAPTTTSLDRARRNAANFKKLAPDAQIEIALNAAAVAAALADPRATDEYIVLCQNTLTATGATAPETLRVVPSVVLHIAQRQAEGWGYLRA